MKAENARFDYSKEIQIENKKSVIKKEKRKMSELERFKEEEKESEE